MKKIIIYIIGLNFLALGIVLNISTGLGVAALQILSIENPICSAVGMKMLFFLKIVSNDTMSI